MDTIETGRIAGEIANKILKGTPTSRVPVQELQKPKVIINLKAAALLGLTIPQNLQDAAAKSTNKRSLRLKVSKHRQFMLYLCTFATFKK